MTPERLGLLWGITVFAGAFARLFSSFTGFPSVVILLLSGLLIGRSGLGLVEPLDLGQGLETIVGLLVCLVLFEGGLNLKLPEGNIRNTVLKISLVRLFISLSAGIIIAYQAYFVKKINLTVLFAEKFPTINKFLSNKWYLDDINEKLFVKGSRKLAKEVLEVDSKVVDGVVNLTGLVTLGSGEGLKYFETGRAQFYALIVFGGVILLVAIFGFQSPQVS